ncbi:MAG TPA: GNAT family N-acetyltransferase [Methylomirabilota bacterium]|nr:GNAT family N-acetyltransferase [Methylomirabilota bacterium]
MAESLAAATTKGWGCSCESRPEVLVLAVLPEFEGRGIGKTLLSLAVGWLRSFGQTRIWLSASSDPETRAYGFYRSLSWRPVGKRDPSGDEILVLSNPDR